jgi:hypothetical protein
LNKAVYPRRHGAPFHHGDRGLWVRIHSRLMSGIYR